MEGCSSNALLCASITNVSNFVSEILSGSENYHLWKAQMVCLLKSKNMCGIVDATFVRPGDFCKKTMIQYDNLVKGWIFGSVSKDVLAVVFDLGSAIDVWEKLKAVYDPNMHYLHEDPTTRKSDAKTQKEEIEVVSGETSTKEEAGDLLDILVSPTESAHRKQFRPFDLIHNTSKLRQDTRSGDWLGVELTLRKYPGLAMEAIRRDGSTVLHVAVGTAPNNIVEKLILKLDDFQVLKTRDSDGSTTLHVAALVGNAYAAELLVKKNRSLLRSKDGNGKEPLDKAYENMHLYTIAYLLQAINDDDDDDDDDETKLQSSLDGSVHPHPHEKILADLLINAISAKQYSLAYEMVGRFFNFYLKTDDVLMTLARNFPSGLDYGEELIYPCQETVWEIFSLASPFVEGCSIGIKRYFSWKVKYFEGIYKKLFDVVVVVAKLVTLPVYAMIALPLLSICLLVTFVYVIFLQLYILVWNGAKIIFGPIKRIDNKKKEWNEAKKLLSLVCDEIDRLKYSGTYHHYYSGPILEAACHNAFQVVKEILLRSPEAIQCSDTNGYDIIQLAIINRSESIYNLIYKIGERKNLYRTLRDSSENNILHLAAKLAPSSVLNQRTGAALQLQRELQWRDEVKKFVFPTYLTQENESNETPYMIFTKEHKDLVKEGENWMKTTAESCGITAALITTIVFAAAITVPGGSNQEKGTPLFKKKAAFIVFAVADAISLFASSTALLVFLSILTARFAEKDFLVSLPRRLFIGLFSLVLSTTAMMVAFSATLFLVFCDEKLWMLVPICGLVFIPIAFFVGLQFPLMVDLFRSTYIGVFGKRVKRRLLVEIRRRLYAYILDRM